MKRFNRTLASAIATAAAIGAWASLATALAGTGGLTISPGIFEHPAHRGAVGSLKVSNTTGAPMRIKVGLRPWLQARTGAVSPNRRRRLHDVGASASSFTLAGGATRTVAISLKRTPRKRSQYGAIEVTGLPAGRVKSGVKVAYRLISSLRLDAPAHARRYRARAGRLIEQGTVGHGALLLAVRNRGNTIVPIGANVRVSGQGHSLSGGAAAKAIVPGHTVDVLLTRLTGSLPAGRYRVSVSLTQAGHHLRTVNRTIGLR